MVFGLFLCVLTAFCWGSTSFLLRGIKSLNASEMSFMRASGGLLCGLFLLIFMHRQLASTLTPAEILIFIALVLCNNVIGDVFLFFALQRLGVARGASIASAYPIPVAIASYLFFGAELSLPVICGTLSVVAGISCLCHTEKSVSSLSVTWIVCAVLACFFWAAGFLCNKQLVVLGLSPITIVLGRGVTFFTIALAVLLARLGLARENAGFRSRIHVQDLLRAFIAGVLSLGFGAWLYSLALEYVSPTVATTISASNPMIAAVMAMIIYKEKVHPIQWAGIALAITGTVLVGL